MVEQSITYLNFQVTPSDHGRTSNRTSWLLWVAQNGLNTVTWSVSSLVWAMARHHAITPTHRWFNVYRLMHQRDGNIPISRNKLNGQWSGFKYYYFLASPCVRTFRLPNVTIGRWNLRRLDVDPTQLCQIDICFTSISVSLFGRSFKPQGVRIAGPCFIYIARISTVNQLIGPWEISIKSQRKKSS